ncbi:hypothetical protein AGLY_017390 [Aphis glycines]|uniref:Integrase catalytic domain-containing protein n=1 Tax=Aphis glycines TaxID=307491 RepID=A0A6G0SVM5_APHGL|nr:hypothetical protein AGLY_017390 [Aphis glycines]
MNNENKNSEKSEDNLNPSKFSSQDISKFLKPQLIAELTKRNLITTGTVPELKNRLTQYLNGETTPNDFINTFNANKMDNTKKPYYKPNTFSGLISENIDTFIKKYNRAASINGWSDEEKIKFLPLYLEGPALTFYDNNESNLINDIKWADLENILLSEFKPTAQLDMLKLLLQKRKQLDDEQTINYVNEIESLCKRINPTMLESEIIHTVIKGIMENNTLKQLKDNLRKFDLIEFMVTGENPNLVKQNHFLNQNYTNNKIQNCEICLLNNHTTATCFRNKNNIQPQQYKVCLKNNHRTENCYFNNKPTITCQICDKAGHSAKTSNITDRCSPSSPEFPKYKYKINNITEPLYIKATLNNITIPVTIDTGANICCIRHTLMPPNSNLKKEPIILTGANNKPLTLFGSILIKLKINSREFEIKAYVIENLSCHIIIGNKFLYQYNANINFKNSTLTLRKNNNDNKINNDIIIQTYNVYNSNNVHNIKEDVKNIFQTNSEYSIAHCISADLKMNKGLAAQIKNKFGDASAQLKNLKPMVGEAIPINMGNRTIYYLITKQKYFLKPTYDNIKTTLQNLKKTMNKLHDYKIAISTIAAGLNKRNWSMTKQLIYHEFQNSNIEYLFNYYNYLTFQVIGGPTTNWHLLPAIIIMILTYLTKMQKQLLPPIILYNTNENTHWIPGTKAINPSLKIPHDYVEINDFTPLQQIVTEINNKYKNIKKPITNDKLKEIDKVDKIHIKTVDNITKSITNDPNKEIIYDSEGTPINISHELDPLQYSQVLTLLKEYIHLFTSDASNIKPANIKPCRINKKINGKPIGQLQPIPLSNRPLDRLTFDYLGPLTPSNNKKYVLVAACNNTKFIFTKAVESATAESTINFIIQIISQWGCFRQFSSDRGTHFKNQMVNEVCENLGIKQILSTSYSPQTQGFVEKINYVLCNSIKNYIDDNNQSRWSYYLPYVTLSYNATPQTSTKYSPFYLMHGFEPYFPIDNKLIPTNIPYDIKKSLAELNKLRDKIPNLIKTAQESQKKYHDQKHRLITFKPGDSVLIKFPLNTVGKCPKLSSKYKGPFKIIKKLNDLNYKVQLSLNNKITEDIIHVRRMKPYIHRIYVDA